MLGELVAAGLNQQGMLWATSPVCTELETVMMDWMVDLLGLPADWKTTAKGGGVMQQTASDAAHVAVVVARDRAQRLGADISRCVAYTSTQAHSSIEKGARVAGYQHIRLIDVDDVYAMDIDGLAAAVARDRASGLIPTFVCSTVRHHRHYRGGPGARYRGTGHRRGDVAPRGRGLRRQRHALRGVPPSSGRPGVW